MGGKIGQVGVEEGTRWRRLGIGWSERVRFVGALGFGVVCLGLLVIIIYYSLELIDSYK